MLGSCYWVWALDLYFIIIYQRFYETSEEIEVDGNDSDDNVMWVLDNNNQRRLVTSSGVRIILPKIPGQW